VATAAVAASVMSSALALSTTVQTTQTINELSMMVTTALDKQAIANSQIQGGLMLINQRINIVQEQVDILWQLAQVGCEYKMTGLCVTSVQFESFTRAANLSKNLSCYMLQNWTMQFEQTLRELRVAILQVNSTCLNLLLTEGFSTLKNEKTTLQDLKYFEKTEKHQKLEMDTAGIEIWQETRKK
jgi:hypothetical protein